MEGIIEVLIKGVILHLIGDLIKGLIKNLIEGLKEGIKRRIIRSLSQGIIQSLIKGLIRSLNGSLILRETLRQRYIQIIRNGYTRRRVNFGCGHREKLAILVVIGVDSEGKKRLLAIHLIS
ncbi:MAG: hypothetical protein ABIK97_02170 [candidate division WOR-3 bacterium]